MPNRYSQYEKNRKFSVETENFSSGIPVGNVLDQGVGVRQRGAPVQKDGQEGQKNRYDYFKVLLQDSIYICKSIYYGA